MKSRELLFVGVAIVVTIGLAMGGKAGPPPSVVTGYVTEIWHDPTDHPRVNYGREFRCTLQNTSLSDSNDCAMDWCEWFVNRNEDPNDGNVCRLERLAEAIANREVDKRKNYVSDVNYYEKRKQ